jgi:hypothetical protein
VVNEIHAMAFSNNSICTFFSVKIHFTIKGGFLGQRESGTVNEANAPRKALVGHHKRDFLSTIGVWPAYPLISLV